MVANTLYKSNNHVAAGEVSIAGVTPSNETYWSNLVTYIDQIDRLHSYLTVKETAEFAWRCRTGGTHMKAFYGEGPEVREIIAKRDEEMVTVHRILDVLGLTRVKDTFVGDQSTVRGVSGGEKKRVTLAEMLVINVPVLCCDEISTGLDAATTFDSKKHTRLCSVVRFSVLTLRCLLFFMQQLLGLWRRRIVSRRQSRLFLSCSLLQRL
jgi:ABC-type multidrug transport system ATPase subunit